MFGLHKNAGKLTSHTIKSLLLRNPIFIAILEKGGVGREIVELLSTRISADKFNTISTQVGTVLFHSFLISQDHGFILYQGLVQECLWNDTCDFP